MAERKLIKEDIANWRDVQKEHDQTEEAEERALSMSERAPSSGADTPSGLRLRNNGTIQRPVLKSTGETPWLSVLYTAKAKSKVQTKANRYDLCFCCLHCILTAYYPIKLDCNMNVWHLSDLSAIREILTLSTMRLSSRMTLNRMRSSRQRQTVLCKWVSCWLSACCVSSWIVLCAF